MTHLKQNNIRDRSYWFAFRSSYLQCVCAVGTADAGSLRVWAAVHSSSTQTICCPREVWRNPSYEDSSSAFLPADTIRHTRAVQGYRTVPIRVGNRKSIPESDTSGQESDTCCQIQFSIPPIDSYVLLFLFICEDRRESNERGKGTPAKWASAEQWDAVRLYVSKTILPVLSAVTVHALITSS